MTVRSGIRLFVALACALFALAPGFARAAFVPMCEADPIATMPPASACAMPSSVLREVLPSSSAAPLCDPRGASAIAPQRVLPVSDARLEGSRSCGDDETAFSVGPRSPEPPDGANALAVVEIGFFGDASLRAPMAPYVELPAFVAEARRARRGERVDVFHPPR